MSIYYPEGCNLPEFIAGCCPRIELGRVRSVWIQNSAFNFVDITDPNEWTTAIADGNIIIFPFTNGSADVATNTSDGYGSTPFTTDSYSYTLNAHDPILENICNGWNLVVNNNFWRVGWNTQTMSWLSDVPATFEPSVPIAADVTKKIDIMVKITFVQSLSVCPIPNDALIREIFACPEVAH